ncbi:MAG: glutaredoxin 3 [Coxiellaceae bacterium]|nr:glutaredoxin 3 [Coxiellaceae bacterium]
MMAKVEIYSTNSCPSCVRAKQLLDQKGVAYTEYKVDEDQDKFKEMKLRTNGGRTVPAIFIDDEHVGGFDALYALEKAGELDAKLK